MLDQCLKVRSPSFLSWLRHKLQQNETVSNVKVFYLRTEEKEETERVSFCQNQNSIWNCWRKRFFFFSQRWQRNSSKRKEELRFSVIFFLTSSNNYRNDFEIFCGIDFPENFLVGMFCPWKEFAIALFTSFCHDSFKRSRDRLVEPSRESNLRPALIFR